MDRSRDLCLKSVWRCEFLLDDKEGRPFCSSLCGDAQVQIECDNSECKSHGCAACFTDGNVRKVKIDESAGVFRGWRCTENEDEDDDDFDDDDETGLGIDGIATGVNWWSKEARRCKETGRLVSLPSSLRPSCLKSFFDMSITASVANVIYILTNDE